MPRSFYRPASPRSRPVLNPAADRCDACRRLVPARKQMTLYDDPNVLVIHLKRFDGFHGGKIPGHIDFDETLGAWGGGMPRSSGEKMHACVHRGMRRLCACCALAMPLCACRPALLGPLLGGTRHARRPPALQTSRPT